MWRGAAAPAAAASERRGESARLGALEAGLRAWKSAAGRGGGALRPAGLLPRVASPPGAARPHAGAETDSAQPCAAPPSARAASPAVAPTAAMGGRAAPRLQSEWAAEIRGGAGVPPRPPGTC